MSEHLAERIIPARAGFTPRVPGWFACRTDHPRSRGVYRAKDTYSRYSAGSSPLARGLLKPGCVGGDNLGIIPARAGFTRVDLTPLRSQVGSSPLARGLPDDGTRMLPATRIIPARAGFTDGAWIEDRDTPDHPRSRGVYQAMRKQMREHTGSSPLARGLLTGTGTLRRRRRIIPARAGFTGRPPWRGRGVRDHPRSRGVYGFICPVSNRVGGSSPLARGLRMPPTATSLSGGIIPARAGFTPVHLLQRPVLEDHPRSRGVYLFDDGCCEAGPGSSPLARGLRLRIGFASLVFGIIPARAGFTFCCHGFFERHWDHPRSRGVYAKCSELWDAAAGSSPLARGLRPSGPADTQTGRIIPARAGFTSTASSGSNESWDHPRSRGVYAGNSADSLVDWGSSPLARGLQYRLGPTSGELGIIPARAGFTHYPQSPLPSETDHPRSRGVYPGPVFQPASLEGSSPLARGLQLISDWQKPLSRIIPARAGFTPTGCPVGGQ